MKKLHVFLAIIFGILIVWSCSDKEKEDQAKNKKDRNMAGLRIKRGLTKTSEGLAEGYVMFAVPNSGSVYLINRKGEVVKEWKSTYNSFNAYINNDSSVFLGVNDPDYPVFGGGGPYGRIQKIGWNNRILWDFEYATEDYILHHDFAVMPNGNILALAYEVMPYEDALARGRKPEITPKDGPWFEKIIEIQPEGKHHGKIVWEWHLWDHFIQENDPQKKNYGSLSEHPELLDINSGRELPKYISQDSVETLLAMGRGGRNMTAGNRGADIFHFNAINYNASLDQIVVSSPQLSEIFMIDHSTTIEEAASHMGGKSGIGGDFIYRWGNPKNYQRGDSTDQKLFGQHDVRWIEEGNPGAGNLTVFNNDMSGRKDSLEYSAVYEITTPVNENGNYVKETGKPFGPEKPTWVYVAPDSISFWSNYISGAHRMKNGNTFINEGAKGRFFEVTPEGKTVWEYLNPYVGEARQLNGDPIGNKGYSQFRSTFIPADHPALAGKKLTPINPQPMPFVLPPLPKEEKK